MQFSLDSPNLCLTLTYHNFFVKKKNRLKGLLGLLHSQKSIRYITRGSWVVFTCKKRLVCGMDGSEGREARFANKNGLVSPRLSLTLRCHPILVQKAGMRVGLLTFQSRILNSPRLHLTLTFHVIFIKVGSLCSQKRIG